MIELINASKSYPTRFGRHHIFRNVSLKLPSTANIGIIGANGAGKSTLMRLLAGVDFPTEGRIVRSGRISWPLGLTPGMLGALTGRENARFVCRIYGMTGKEIEQKLIRIAEVASIGNYFDMPVRTYSFGMRSRLNFATSMAIDFDYYLFDEIGAPGDRAFKQTSKAMVEQRLAKSKFIMSSHNPQDLLDLCDSAILIGGGELRFFDDVREALREYGEVIDVPAASRRKQRRQTRATAKDSTAENPEALQEMPRVSKTLPLAPRKRKVSKELPTLERLPSAALPTDDSAAPPLPKPALRGRLPKAVTAPRAGKRAPRVPAPPAKTVVLRRAVRLNKPPKTDGPGSQ